MILSNEDFVEDYRELESARHYRNRWAAVGAGGMAVGAVVALTTGQYSLGGLIAVGSALAVEKLVLEAHGTVTEYREDLDWYIKHPIDADISEEEATT